MPELTEKLKRLGYPDFEIVTDEVPMLHVDGSLICGVDYALSLPDEQLKKLIDDTVAGEQS